jgi:hypothetical protein
MRDHVDRVEDERGDAQYGPRAVLDAAALDCIREANLGFLALVARAARTGLPHYGLDVATMADVASLEPIARRAAASLPYTLFNLRFEDQGFWQDIVQDAARPGAASLDDDATFARTAVFLAWHLVQGDDAAPAMVLGMAPAVVEVWRRLPLSALDLAATRALPLLEARWGAHARFWPRLSAAVRGEAPSRLVDLRDLGLRLLAAQGLAGTAGSA